MNKIALTLILSALLVANVACSSKEKKQEDTTSASIENTIQDMQTTEPTEKLSLGASSSGLGH